MGKFWMCFVEGASSPQHKHSTLVEATAEAERLARTLFKKVVVLEAVSAVALFEVKWETLTKPHDEPVKPDDGFPF